jgi:hypothetical protein
MIQHQAPGALPHYIEFIGSVGVPLQQGFDLLHPVLQISASGFQTGVPVLDDSHRGEQRMGRLFDIFA